MAAAITYSDRVEEGRLSAAHLVGAGQFLEAGANLRHLLTTVHEYYPAGQQDIARIHGALIRRDLGTTTLHEAIRRVTTAAGETRLLFETADGLYGQSATILGDVRASYGARRRARSVSKGALDHVTQEQGASLSARAVGWLVQAVLDNSEGTREFAIVDARRLFNDADAHFVGDNANYAVKNSMHHAQLQRLVGESIWPYVGRAVGELFAHRHNRLSAIRTLGRIGMTLFSRSTVEKSIRKGCI